MQSEGRVVGRKSSSPSAAVNAGKERRPLFVSVFDSKFSFPAYESSREYLFAASSLSPSRARSSAQISSPPLSSRLSFVSLPAAAAAPASTLTRQRDYIQIAGTLSAHTGADSENEREREGQRGRSRRATQDSRSGGQIARATRLACVHRKTTATMFALTLCRSRR